MIIFELCLIRAQLIINTVLLFAAGMIVIIIFRALN